MFGKKKTKIPIILLLNKFSLFVCFGFFLGGGGGCVICLKCGRQCILSVINTIYIIHTLKQPEKKIEIKTV